MLARTGTVDIYVNGTLTKSESLTTVNVTKSVTGTLSLTAGDLVRIDLTAPSSGWSQGLSFRGYQCIILQLVQTVLQDLSLL